MQIASGTILDGRYRVERELGAGAHGAVYEAVDEQLGARVALKCLHASIAAQPGYKTRLLREARAMGALAGTSAVQVLGFGKLDRGGMYIAMELLRGSDLKAYLDGIEAKGERLGVRRLVELMGPIVDTLEAAHRIGIIHRDLKPGNIMVLDNASRGPVRLLDFGLAKDLAADPLTMEGWVAGSPAYIAPETWEGNPDVIDHRVDVYALGAIIYRALAGEAPFDARRPMIELILSVRTGLRPTLFAVRPDLPRAIDGWVAQALAANREQRFQGVRALWDAFLALV